MAAAEELAHACGARLRVLHVIEPVPVPHFMAPDFDMSVVAQRATEEFSRRTAQFRDDVKVDRVTRSGLPVEMIALEAGDWKPDVIVMGSHGRGWFDRLVVGSVTEGVLNRLPAALLVVPVHQVRSSAVHESSMAPEAMFG
jgi:nucleotide-binding universal stress UspA family protein